MKCIKTIWTGSVCGLLLWTSSVVYGGIYLVGTGAVVTNKTVAVAWDPSPDANVVGYHLCYGAVSGNLTNSIDAGAKSTATLAGFVPEAKYFFTVKAYDATGVESQPSNEIQYTAAGLPSATLKAAVVVSNTKPTKTMSLNFQATVGVTYQILATTDFKTWTPVLTTNMAASGSLTLPLPNNTSEAQQFYKVAQY